MYHFNLRLSLYPLFVKRLFAEEDIYGSYSRLILKYFLSEGVMCGHSLFLASASEDPEDMIKVNLNFNL